MNKDFRHKKVNTASPLLAWRDEIRRRIANASRRATHRRERREGKREINSGMSPNQLPIL